MRANLALSLLAVLCLVASDAQAGPQDDLMAQARLGNLEGVNKALGAGANVNALNADGSSALSVAYFWPEVTKLLLSKGAKPDLGSASAVASAAANYSTEVLKLLLDAGADPNKPTLLAPATGIRMMIAGEQAKGKAANQANIKA